MNPSLLIVFVTIFIDLLGFGIIIPILPFYAQEYGALGTGVGLLMMSYSLMQFIGAPLWGRISDRYGRRPVLVFGLLGTGAGMLILGFAQSFAWLVAGRILGGLAGANISTAYAYVTDITSEENRAKSMGLLGAAFGLGFTLGPGIGGVLSKYSHSLPMFVAAGLSFANFIFAWAKLKESNPGGKSARKEKGGTPLSVLKIPRTGLAIVLFFAFTFALTQLEVVFALFMGSRYGFTAHDVGMVMMGIGMVMVLTQGGMVGRLSKKYGEGHLVLVSLFVAAVSFFAYAITHSLWVSMLMLTLLSIGRGILQPALSSLASLGLPSNIRGLAMGTFQSGSALARVIGPPIAGFLYDHAGAASPFYLGAAVLASSFIISFGPLKGMSAHAKIKK